MSTNNIKKKDLINSLFKNIGFPKIVCENIVVEIFTLIKNNLMNNDSIKISKFGTFSKKFKKERIGRNPKTKDVFAISARKSIKFITSKKISENLNKLS